LVVDPSPKQLALYSTLLKDGAALLRSETGADKLAGETDEDYLLRLLVADEGKVTAKNAMHRLLRARQVCGGYLYSDDRSVLWEASPNPKLRALLSMLQDIPGKVVVWVAFVDELRAVARGLQDAGISYVTYYGEVPVDERRQARLSFASENGAKVFLGTAAAAGTGLNELVVANVVIYYSNTLKAGDRWQSEDRTHRIGLRGTVVYYDLVLRGTCDTKLLGLFDKKKRMASFLLGDPNNVALDAIVK